jgi:NADH:ubiquinone oxidoreductase subunit 6 (subunit J)
MSDDSDAPITRTDVHLIIAIFLGALIGVHAWDLTSIAAYQDVWGTAPEAVESISSIAQILFTDWAVPLEVLGILLLVALVGALAMAMRKHHHGGSA